VSDKGRHPWRVNRCLTVDTRTGWVVRAPGGPLISSGPRSPRPTGEGAENRGSVWDIRGTIRQRRCLCVVFGQVTSLADRQARPSVKPSAQPTLVRTQHLPPPAKTARERGILRSRGPSCVVSSSVIVGQETALGHESCGHIADGYGAEGAVHRTACSVSGRRKPATPGLHESPNSPAGAADLGQLAATRTRRANRRAAFFSVTRTNKLNWL